LLFSSAPPPPRSPLFPSTTLFRSPAVDPLRVHAGADRRAAAGRRRGGRGRGQRADDGVTNGGLTTCIGVRRPRMSTSTRAPSPSPAAVSNNARPIPTLRVGENVPLVTSPTSSPPA